MQENPEIVHFQLHQPTQTQTTTNNEGVRKDQGAANQSQQQ